MSWEETLLSRHTRAEEHVLPVLCRFANQSRSCFSKGKIAMANGGTFFGSSLSLLKQTFSEWLEDKAPQLGAAHAYYTVFSLAPLILVLLAIVGLIIQSDPAGALNKIIEQMSYFLDKSAVDVVQN